MKKNKTEKYLCHYGTREFNFNNKVKTSYEKAYDRMNKLNYKILNYIKKYNLFKIDNDLQNFFINEKTTILIEERMLHDPFKKNSQAYQLSITVITKDNILLKELIQYLTKIRVPIENVKQ